MSARLERIRRVAQAQWRRVRGQSWARRRNARPVSDDAVVTFAVPLIGQARAQDWALVQRNLLATLGALIAQTDGRWEVIICGQDRPAIDGLDDRIRFLPFDRPHKPGELTDHRHKARAIRNAIAADRDRDGYLFYLDADDIVHPDLVAHMMTTRHPDGYLIAEGYMLDVASGALAYLGPSTDALPEVHPFWQASGSSNAIRFDRRAGQDYMLAHKFRGSHMTLPENMKDFGLVLADIAFPAALYATNHGQNLRNRRGKGKGHATYLQRNQVPEGAAADIRAAFGLTVLFEWVAAQADARGIGSIKT